MMFMIKYSAWDYCLNQRKKYIRSMKVVKTSQTDESTTCKSLLESMNILKKHVSYNVTGPIHNAELWLHLASSNFLM